MTHLLEADARRRRLAVGVAVGVAVVTAVATYLPGLDLLNAPTIGDEQLYIQIVRDTGQSGKALPLLSEHGITDTKPPLLFWQGMVATNGGHSWDLARLRVSVVLLSFATAIAAGFLAWRLTGEAITGSIAALVYLGFLSTIQHGRPLLTNAGETLFVFLPMLLVQGRRRTGVRLGLAAGLLLGVASLYKSVFLLVPATCALGAVLLSREGFSVRQAIRHHGAFLATALAVGLATFMVWPLLDPRPDLIWTQFIVGENLTKIQTQGWIRGLFSGRYPIWRIWLGDITNAGLYAPAVVALLVDLWRRRRSLAPEERELWLYVLAFLVVYSFPSQRQENYLLPSCPVLAVLIASRWRALPALALRAPLAMVAIAATALLIVLPRVGREIGPDVFGPLAYAFPALLAVAATAGAISSRIARAAFPHLALGVLLAAWPVLEPFSRPFPDEALTWIGRQAVLAPSRFRAGVEKTRFQLPGVDLRAYDCPPGPVRCPPPPPTGLALLTLDVGEEVPDGWEPITEVPALRQRHSPQQITRLLSGDLSLLVERLVLARPASGPVTPATLRSR